MAQRGLRHIALVALFVGLAMACFVGGYVYAVASSLKGWPAVTMYQQLLSDAIEDFAILSQLDEGRIDRARVHLNICLDGHALVASNFLKCAPTAEDRRAAETLLWRIKEHRKKHPFVREEAIPEVEAAVQEALSKAVNHLGSE